MMLKLLAASTLLATVEGWWKDEPPYGVNARSKEPPYPFPVDRKYNTGALCPKPHLGPLSLFAAQPLCR